MASLRGCLAAGKRIRMSAVTGVPLGPFLIAAVIVLHSVMVSSTRALTARVYRGLERAGTAVGAEGASMCRLSRLPGAGQASSATLTPNGIDTQLDTQT